MTGDRAVHQVERSRRRPLYVERVNAVIDYIEQHLAEEMTLSELAAVAHFSPYHFHRVFGVLVGETLNRFISRVRIERAATLLLQLPHSAVTEIAVSCGFPNPSSFARNFKEAFSMSATEWRAGGYLRHERTPPESYRDMIGDIGAIGERYGTISKRFDRETGHPTWMIRCGDLEPAMVTVEQLPALEVAYVRHTGRYQGMGEVFADMFNRLMTWAHPRDLVTPDARVLAVYHDNPDLTDDDKLRVSACLSVPTETSASGEVGRMRIDGGTYGVGHFRLGEQDYSQAWFALVGGWLPESGYEPDDRYNYERYFQSTEATPSEKEVVDICIPVRPLRRY